MPKSNRARFVALVGLLARRLPEVDVDVITERRLVVDGRVVLNPRARVRSDASLRLLPEIRLRGDVKLSHALDALGVRVAGRVAVDVGASAGGFTVALLDRGAARVYAVDAGAGQLLGRLRADPRAVNLERHNLARLDATVVPDVVELVTMDLSYLAVAEAVPQLARLAFSPEAELVALVKPTFELHRGTLAASADDVELAVEHAAHGIATSGWMVVGRCDAPATGRRGAREAFIHARRTET